MARPRSRRRRGAASETTDPTARGDDDTVALDGPEHAWWTQREVDRPWAPRRGKDGDDEPERDVLAEHFGADWRTSFDRERDDEPSPAPADHPSEQLDLPEDTSDPYAVLRVDPSASWEEIVDAHRRMARHHHPDRFFGQSDAEVAAAEDSIRAINAAYQELRIRRGK